MTSGIAWTRKRNEWLAEENLRVRLDCGLEVAFARRPCFQRKTAILTVRFGSLDTAFSTGSGDKVETPAGTAHFLEHRLFQSEDGDVSDKMAALGASSNAATSYSSTSYYFSCVDNFFPSLSLLLGFMDGLHVTPEMVDRERDIIAEEIRGYQDNPSWVGYQAMMAGLYVKSPARLDIGGTLQSIARIDAGVLGSAYLAFYSPANCFLTVSGDIDAGELSEALSRFDAGARLSAPPSRVSVDEPRTVAFRSAVIPMLVSKTKIALALKDDPIPAAGEASVRAHTCASVALSALFGRGSDFYRDAYESGLVEESFGFQVQAEPGLANAAFTADTDRPDELAAAILTRIESAKRSGIPDEDFDRIIKRVKGRFVRNFNHPDTVAFTMAHYMMRGVDLLDVPAIFDLVTRVEVDGVLAARFDTSRHVRTMVVPGPVSADRGSPAAAREGM